MATTFEDAKSDLMERAKARMTTEFSTAQWTVRQKVAITCRVLFDRGHDSGLAGQISARAEEPGTFFTQRFGLGFDEVTEGNLVLVDEDLNVVSGSGIPNPANRFHSWIYRARPDVNCIIHTHPKHIVALSMLEIPLQVSQMDTTPLYEDCAFLKDWPGVPVGNEEGKILSAALGDKRALLMAHHGQLVVGDTVDEACSVAVLIERAAELQMLAMSVGTIQELPKNLAREAHDWTLNQKRSAANFAYYARRALAAHPETIDT